jgi:hypothetical protein
MKIGTSLLVALGGCAALLMPGISLAGNVGYMDMCGGNQAAHATAITTAGHTPVAITTPNAASLSGLSALSVTNCDNGGFSATWTSNLADVTTAVGNGMTLLVHDRTVTNANTILPGGAGLSMVRDTNLNDIDLPAGSPLLSGPGGTLNNTSLDGGNSSTHGYVTAASLPVGGSVLAHRPVSTEGVTVRYPYGSGTVVYSGIPLDFYLGGSGNNPPRDNMVNIYLPNLLAAVAGPGTTCASEGYTGTKLEWCKNICERGYTGATLNMWIRRWIDRYRNLPYCAVAPPPPPPQEG